MIGKFEMFLMQWDDEENFEFEMNKYFYILDEYFSVLLIYSIKLTCIFIWIN